MAEAVVEVGLAVGGWAVGVEMVGVAPFGRPVAARKSAAAVADDDGAVLGGAEQAGSAAEVEEFTVGAHDHSADPAATQQALHGGGQHGAAAEDVAAAVGVELAGQGGGVDHDVHRVGGIDPAVLVAETEAGQLDQGVVAALGQRPGAAGRVLPVGRFEFVEGGFQHGELFGGAQYPGLGEITHLVEPRTPAMAEISRFAPVGGVVGMRRPPAGHRSGVVDPETACRVDQHVGMFIELLDPRRGDIARQRRDVTRSDLACRHRLSQTVAPADQPGRTHHLARLSPRQRRVTAHPRLGAQRPIGGPRLVLVPLRSGDERDRFRPFLQIEQREQDHRTIRCGPVRTIHVVPARDDLPHARDLRNNTRRCHRAILRDEV